MKWDHNVGLFLSFIAMFRGVEVPIFAILFYNF